MISWRNLTRPKVIIPAVIAFLVSFSAVSVSGAPQVQTANVDFTINPAATSLALGDIVDVTIQFDASSNSVGAVQAYLDFDPNVLQVVDTNGNPVATITDFPLLSNNWAILQNSVNNVTGKIDIAAGKTPVTGTDLTSVATLATFRFKAKSTTSSTIVTFATVAPRRTKAVSGFNDVTGNLTDTTLFIGSFNDVTINFSIQGHGGSGPSWTMPVTIEVYTTGTNNLVVSANPTSAASTGNASSVILPGVIDGIYDIWFKGDNTLSKFITGVAISSSAATVDMGEQIGGDATGGPGGAPDNVVDLPDYANIQLIPFGAATGSLSVGQQRQDHNRDGVIDIVDYAVIIENFEKVGDARP